MASKQPPGPPGFPWIGNGLPVARDPLGFLTCLARDYGDIVRFRLPGQDVYLLNHPDVIDQVLRAENEHLVKDSFTRQISYVTGNGLLTSEGAFWKRQRRLAQPAFHHQRVQSYAEAMVHFAERTAADFREGEVRDVHRDMMRLTLAVVAKTLFGVELDRVAREISESLEVLVERFVGLSALIPTTWPTPGNLRSRSALARLDAIVYDIIRQRRASGDTGDLLSLLMAATTDEDVKMSDRQLRDESITLLLAGHETTAIALSFALDLLGRHPEIDAALADEIRTVLGDREPSAADVPKLVVADGVIREALRLFPPAWAIGREAIERFRIGDYEVAPGTQLWIAQWVVHRDARFFPEPGVFRPSRWSGDAAKSLPRFAYFPFGGGPRVCIGNAFAMMEATLLLVTLMRRVRLVPANDRPLALNPAVTLRPRHGVKMAVHRR